LDCCAIFPNVVAALTTNKCRSITDVDAAGGWCIRDASGGAKEEEKKSHCENDSDCGNPNGNSDMDCCAGIPDPVTYDTSYQCLSIPKVDKAGGWCLRHVSGTDDTANTTDDTVNPNGGCDDYGCWGADGTYIPHDTQPGTEPWNEPYEHNKKIMELPAMAIELTVEPKF